MNLVDPRIDEAGAEVIGKLRATLPPAVLGESRVDARGIWWRVNASGSGDGWLAFDDAGAVVRYGWIPSRETFLDGYAEPYGSAQRVSLTPERVGTRPGWVVWGELDPGNFIVRRERAGALSLVAAGDSNPVVLNLAGRPIAPTGLNPHFGDKLKTRTRAADRYKQAMPLDNGDGWLA